MACDRFVIHFKLQSLGQYESFIERQLQGSKDYDPSFFYIRQASQGRLSRIPSRKLGFTGWLPWVISPAKELGAGQGVIHAHFGSNALLAFPATLGSSLPLVVSFYGHDYSVFPRRFLGLGKWMLQRLFRSAETIIAMTDFMRCRLVELGCPQRKIVIYFPGIRSLEFSKRKLSSLSNLLMVSALRPKKNHLLVIKALKILKDRGLSFTLNIVGDGPLRGEIQSLVKRCELEDSVRLRGRYQSDSELIRYFEESDLLLHPSTQDESGDSEGLPSSILEALSVGLPTVISEHAGLAKELRHGVSVVSEHDPLDLARTLEELSGDLPKLQALQNDAREFYRQRFLNTDFVAEREAIYENAVREFNLKKGYRGLGFRQ
jgi:colanic acid/amylovoran biosynthesis glycosyltransferase